MSERATGLVTFGEAMGRVTVAPIGLLEVGSPMSLSMAGAEVNVAIGAARLGVDVTYVGRLGKDAVGDLIERRVRAEQVDCRITRDTGFTGLMLCSRRNNATTRVDYHRAGSAGSHLAPEDIPVDLIGRAGLLHLTGITPALSESACAATFFAARTAKQHGVTVSLDINYRSKLWTPHQAAVPLRKLVDLADIVFAGPSEAALILPGHEVADRELSEVAEILAKLGPRETIVKDGARGCAAVIDDVTHVQPAVSVEVLDPVGAGDAFVAGYLAERLAGADGPTRLLTATRAGAYAVTVPGDCEGLPFRRDLDSLAHGIDVDR